jgi:hypothetical protein
VTNFRSLFALRIRGISLVVDVNATEVGDNFDEEFVGEREEGWKGHCGV